MWMFSIKSDQGILTEGEDSVRLTSLHQLLKIMYFFNENIIYIWYKTS